jgi:hypothetical protein
VYLRGSIDWLAQKRNDAVILWAAAPAVMQYGIINRFKALRRAASQSTRKAMTMPTTWKILALIVALTASIAAAHADDYPSHPIRLVVPYTPGGGADSVARIVAKRVSQTIGQMIVIENRGGAGSIIGTEVVQKSVPDGYTLLLGQSGPISINPAVYKNLRYDPVKDFAPITMTTAYPSRPTPPGRSPLFWRKVPRTLITLAYVGQSACCAADRSQAIARRSGPCSSLQ